MLEERVLELKQFIAANDGRNAADRGFARAVDDLVAAFYDGMGHIGAFPSRAVFDLFLIKVLYVERRSAHGDVIDYLGEMLESFLYAHRLFPAGEDGKPRRVYFSDVIDGERRAELADGDYEAYKLYADSALFFAGVFRRSLTRRRAGGRSPLRRGAPPQGIDASYYITTGKASYRMASQQEEAERTRRRDTLERLAEFFEVYAAALHEVSERYIVGVDRQVVTDKFLDTLNRYRASGDAEALIDLRAYASTLGLRDTP